MAQELVVNLIGDATRFTKMLGDVDGGLSRTADKMEAAGKKMTTHITLPIVGGLALATKAYADFETELNTFQAVAHLSGEEMKRVSAYAIQLGNDAKLPATSAKDAAEAMTEEAKAGLSLKDIMDSTRAVLQLSAAAQISNAEAAQVVGTALNAFHLPGTEAVKVVDLLAGVANNATGEMIDTAYALQSYATVAAGAKIPINDVAVQIALLAKNGLIGSDAGTSLKTALIHLEKPSKEAEPWLAKLNFTIYDGAGKMKSQRQIIDDLSKSLVGYTDEQKNAALASIFGTDGLRTAQIMLAEGVQGWDKMSEAVNKSGQAQAVAEAKTKGLNGTIQALKSQLETLAISLGKIVGSILQTVTPAISGLLTVFDALGTHGQTVVIVIGLLVAALGPLLVVVANVIQAIEFINVAMTFLAANPVVLVIAGIVALVAALVLAYQHCDTFRKAVDAAISWIMDKGAPIVAAFVNFIIDKFNALKGYVMSIWPQISEAITHVWNVIYAVVSSVMDQINLVITVVTNVIMALWRAWGDDLMRMVKTIWNGIYETIQNAFQIIRGVIQVVLSLINGDWGKAWDGVKQIVGAVWNQIGNIISSAAGIVRSALGGVASTIGQVAVGMWDSIKNSFRAVINWIIDRWNGLEFKLPKVGPIGGETIGVPNIPHLALGGPINGLALVGERGPELFAGQGTIVPNNKLGGGGNTYNINVYAWDTQDAGEAAVRAIQSYERSNSADWRN